jgi:prolyl-tRNA synthetase
MTTHRSMQDLFPTTRDGSQVAVSDDITTGQTLLEQGGFIRRTTSGIHAVMPLGFRTLMKIENIINEEMDRAGVLNVQLPVLQPRRLFELTGRWEKYTADRALYSTVESHQGGEFALAPTAEEIVTTVLGGDLRSYRQLPTILHQIGPKFRDEPRPRRGLLRGREFRMSDAYSFDRDEEGMHASYLKMITVYERIFARIGLDDLLLVQADSGAIGGDGSAEFILRSDVGEAKVLTCDRCDYAANVEKCESIYPPCVAPSGVTARQEVATPDIRTIAELCAAFPGTDPTQIVKTLIFVDRESDYNGLVAVCIRGDLDVNPERLSAALGHTLQPAEAEEVLRATGVEVGSLGPVDLRGVDRLVFDESVDGMTAFACGANRTGWHLVGVRFGVDLPVPATYRRVHAAADGHGCPKCDGTLTESRGIEVGHVFQLGLKYSEPLDIEFVGEDDERHVPYMGCFGIGTTRLMQAVAEDRHDDDGLIWPPSISPYDIYAVVTRPDDPQAQSVLARFLERAGADGRAVLVDDRDIRPGRKFADADLIGVPTRVTIGRDAADGFYEVHDRLTGSAGLVPIAPGDEPSLTVVV